MHNTLLHVLNCIRRRKLKYMAAYAESRNLEYLNYSADIFKGKRSPQVYGIMKKKQINSGIEYTYRVSHSFIQVYTASR